MAAAVETVAAEVEGVEVPPTIKVTFYNDCIMYQAIMYCNDWRKKGHKVVHNFSQKGADDEGQFIEVPFDKTLPCPLRITFAASLGQCGENDMFMALEFPNPGHYEVRLGGAGAGHVRLKSVHKVEGPETTEADIDRHLFTNYQGLNMFMEGAAMPATRYGFYVHAEV
mmetsp:Transcript_55887/g.154059  ORF Transcript_55887/g.154059 Transcript_55887/m.154059 type:complete len:168 (+) Transcript_55887:125-628(+)